MLSSNKPLSQSAYNIFDHKRSKTDFSTHPILKKRTNCKYVSGYAAHIPKYVQQVGASFTETSHSARWEFQNKHSRPETAKKIVNPEIVRSSTSLSESYRPVSKGVIPNYGGHIAGYKSCL